MYVAFGVMAVGFDLANAACTNGNGATSPVAFLYSSRRLPIVLLSTDGSWINSPSLAIISSAVRPSTGASGVVIGAGAGAGGAACASGVGGCTSGCTVSGCTGTSTSGVGACIGCTAMVSACGVGVGAGGASLVRLPNPPAAPPATLPVTSPVAAALPRPSSKGLSVAQFCHICS